MAKTDGKDNAFQEGAFGPTNTLTKREYFAVLIMQGYIAANQYSTSHNVNFYSEKAVYAADQLIDELNKEK